MSAERPLASRFTPPPLRIGIDTGGTFTDFVIFDPATGALTTFKLPSTPDNPAEAVLEGIRYWILENTQYPISNIQITHGSTVATNALLERKGARTALITTQGFRDVLAIGRQNRPALYDLTPTLPPPLVPDELRLEVSERVDSRGNILTPLEPANLQALISHLQTLNPESIAICLLFSFLHPAHEQQIAGQLRQAGYFVSASHEILPEYREYERTATTVVNAYVSPIMDKYLGPLEDALGSRRQSDSATPRQGESATPRQSDSATPRQGESATPRQGESAIQRQDDSANQRDSDLAHQPTYQSTHHPTTDPPSPIPQLPNYPITQLQIMQSNGGILSPAQARREAVRCILSGPAGGLVAAQNLPHDSALQRVSESATQQTNKPANQQTNEPITNHQLPITNLLTFDMGGTSTDVSLIQSTPKLTTEAEIGGLPIRVPVLDIHTIGAGGGSIAWIDPGGGLRVGPQSAGAFPGPACYGRVSDSATKRQSDHPTTRPPNHRSPITDHRSPTTDHPLPTVTDANLLLHRLLPDHFLGGKMPLYPDLAEAALTPLAVQLGLSTIETALGIVEIANAHMARALRVISVERGHDPADFTLLSFGGAGGLHAVALARELGIPRVLISPYASVFSALGMLMADVVKDYSQTVMLRSQPLQSQASVENIQSSLAPLLERAKNDLLADGLEQANLSLESQLDVRLCGQSYELTIPFTETWQDTFVNLYRQTYGYAPPQGELEIVTLRVRAIGRVPSPDLQPLPRGDADPTPALLGTQPVYLTPAPQPIPIYDGEKLTPGNHLSGPALILRPDTTILIGVRDQGQVDVYQNLILDIGY